LSTSVAQRYRPKVVLRYPASLQHRPPMLNSTDAFILALGGAVGSADLLAVAENIEHLAQLIDDVDDAREAYRAAAAIRTIADV
jgi:hypothetical protein